MHRTIAFEVDFILDLLDYSHEEASIPVNETDLLLHHPSADLMMKDMLCLVLWNNDKHSYDEVKTIIMELSGKGSGPEWEWEVDAMVRKLEDEGRVMVDMNVISTNPSTAMHGHHHDKLLEMGHTMDNPARETENMGSSHTPNASDVRCPASSCFDLPLPVSPLRHHSGSLCRWCVAIPLARRYATFQRSQPSLTDVILSHQP